MKTTVFFVRKILKVEITTKLQVANAPYKNYHHVQKLYLNLFNVLSHVPLTILILWEDIAMQVAQVI
jgi:hypothetical protein